MDGADDLDDQPRTSLGATRDAVVDSLRLDIIEGRLAPGQRLVERDVAQQLGVSRSPVREALRQLAFEGFLVSLSPRRIVVRELSRSDIEDLYDVREALEWLTAGLVVQHADDDDIATLRRHLEKTRQAEDDEAKHRLSNQFHELLGDMAGNPVLSSLVRPLKGRMQWLLQQNADFERIHIEHTDIIDCIEARDFDAARDHAVQHVRHSRANALHALFPDDDGADGGADSRGRASSAS